MPTWHSSSNSEKRSRWRPGSQEYYGSIISVGNSTSEEYPKKCFNDWVPPKDVRARIVTSTDILAAGRPSGSIGSEQSRKNRACLSKSSRSVERSGATNIGELLNWRLTKNTSESVNPAGLRVSRVLPYPII